MGPEHPPAAYEKGRLDITMAGIPRALLAINLSRGSGDLATSFRGGVSLATIGSLHLHRFPEKGFAHLSLGKGLRGLAFRNFFSVLIVNV
jgi:hypothetical protein